MPSSVQHTDFDGDEEEHESDYNEMEAMANDAHDENGDTNDRNVESNDDDDDLSEEQQQHDDDIIGGIEDDGDDVPDGFEDDDDDIPDGFEGDDHIPNGIARMFAAQIERQLELFAEEQERAEYVQRLQQSNEPLPRPDQHSYLGDESHPLSYVPHDPLLRLPTNPTTPPGGKNNRRRRRRATSSSTVVNGHDDDDDGEDDDQNNKREVAVLEIPGVVLFPGCTIPIKLHDPTMISYIGRQLDVARSDPSKQPQVHVGVITRTGASVRSGSSEDDSSSLDSGGATESDHDDGEGDDDELQQEAGGSENPRNLLSASTGVMRRLIGGRTLRLHSQRRSWMRRGIRNANDRGSGDTNRAVRNAAFANERPKHHSFGRIGTIATITQTHERTSGTIDRSTEQYGDSSVWNRYSNAREIVFTAVGISRFRIIDIVGDSRSRYDGRDGNIFLVEDLIDSPMERPQFFPRPITSLSDGRWRDSDSTISTRTKMLARSYSQVTSIPYFVFAKLSPWSLMEQIVSLLKSRQGRGNLPILDTNVASSSSESDHEDTCDRRTEEEFMDPLRFSFWISNNAPFSQRHKIALLQMNSTVERLENVLRGLRKLTGRERPVVCVNCNARLTTSGQVFTVEGAEGTTSTYVNDHGAIHQIMTLREVDENKIGFQGRASVENTYFPGYCWRISYCRICYSHLGWKFQKLDESPNKTNRPSTFWGFMSSSVKTSR